MTVVSGRIPRFVATPMDAVLSGTMSATRRIVPRTVRACSAAPVAVSGRDAAPLMVVGDVPAEFQAGCVDGRRAQDDVRHDLAGGAFDDRRPAETGSVVLREGDDTIEHLGGVLERPGFLVPPDDAGIAEHGVEPFDVVGRPGPDVEALGGEPEPVTGGQGSSSMNG